MMNYSWIQSMNKMPKKYLKAGWKHYTGFTVEALSRHAKDRQFISKKGKGWELVGYDTEGKLQYKVQCDTLEIAFKAGDQAIESGLRTYETE